MKKFFKEFKQFITRGNVLDMAVGIIIGGAFTAIITAVVNNILTPLLAMIPGSGDTGALQLVLKRATLEDGTLDLANSVIMDFGVVISAIVTFLLTAFVLFIIIKAINTVRAGGKKYSGDRKIIYSEEYRSMRAELKAQGKSRKEIEQAVLDAEKAKEEARKAEQAQKEEEERLALLANAPETLLREIRDLLKANINGDKE